MAAMIVIRTWTKDSSAVEFRPVPPWRTEQMEMEEQRDILRKEQDRGRISGYELLLRREEA